MKFILLLFSFILFLAGCKKYLVYEKLNSKWTDCKSAPFAPVRAIPFDDGQAMEEAYKNCKGCLKPSRYSFDIDDFKKLTQMLEGVGIEISSVRLVPAQYRETDVLRYACRVCDGNSEDEKCQVSGYQTILLKLEVPDSKEGFLYFDFASICPPPRGCDGSQNSSDSTTNTAKDTTKTTDK